MGSTIPAAGYQVMAKQVGQLVGLVYLKYPEQIRRAIYTTNAVESVYYQFCKLGKTKGGFPNETNLINLLYAGMLKASEKWTHPVQNWNLTLSQLSIHLEGRIDPYLDS